jgi:hypothetical protein
MRSLLVPVLAVVTLAGCGSETHAAALASAECASAVHDELGLAESDTSLRTSDVTVDGDDDERRVAGRWEVAGGGHGEFRCVAVPDDSDRLRGLRVTDLDVFRARDPG